MLPAIHYSVAIACNWRAVYEEIWRPEFFSKWATGLAQAGLRMDEQGWLADGPEGTVRIRFSRYNDFGIMDHEVELENGKIVHIPLRVVQNGDGAEVILTLFRQPEMSDEKFAQDGQWIERDLLALKSILVT